MFSRAVSPGRGDAAGQGQRQGARLRGQPRLRVSRRADLPRRLHGLGIASLPVVWFDTSPTLAVAVGAAAGMAAQTRLLFAPLLFATLLVGKAGLDAAPAAVLAAAAAWLTIAALDARGEAQ